MALTDKTTAYSPRTMGRPPLFNQKTTVRVPPDAMARIVELRGSRGVAQFIREAVEEKLARDAESKPKA